MQALTGTPRPGVDAHYARILDGRRLWLAVPDDVPAPALSSSEHGLVTPVDELADDRHAAPPGIRSVRWNLESTLAGLGPGEYAVVVPADDGPRPVRLPDAWPEEVVTSPAWHDRAMDLTLVRGADGDLIVRAAAPRRVVDLLAVSYADGAAELVLDVAAGDRPAISLIDDTDAVVGELAATHDSDGLHCTITADTVPAVPGPYRFVAGGDGLPVVRRDNGLRDSRHVLLPFIPEPDGDNVIGRLIFRPNGRLVLRRVDPAEAESA